jgi:hypothetical protein
MKRPKARSCKLVLFLLLFPVHSLAESQYCRLCLSEERQLLAQYERNRHKASVRAKISRDIEQLRKLRFAHQKEKPESCRNTQSEPYSVLSSTVPSPRPLANAVKEDRKHAASELEGSLTNKNLRPHPDRRP